MLSVHLPARLVQGTVQPAATAFEFSVASGECLVVIGPNGSGKTTLLRLIAQELRCKLGTFELDGQPLSCLSRQQRAQRIAFLAQHDQPDPRLTVSEYVELGRIPYANCVSTREHRLQVNRALADVALEPLASRRLGQLSGGERQRAAVARALAQTPKLLLLDEPTNHLDPIARAALLTLVRRNDLTVIAALHDLDLADHFADRILLLAEGTQIGWDIPERILTTEYLEPIFGLRTITLTHPHTGRSLRWFEPIAIDR